ncbi:hypothetical protein CpB0759 [Chlamydia pneumoniae TW-183]|uniref:Uncharacterized protein n=2 Tax=Chlamydia pneumoniae TaxID=83558 RepID=Q9Z7H4_CHLPN|nr:hypothetical protein CPn_0731 [Chlamydia pneumoniae CWL029]AAF37911.1 hypothetical protein CP_0015 [Chlamydia pneumoniae AR39]AAP98688.1 hypothetical protein CpB0759 [Chlamydia pneumoniae TW-183]ACZ32619.1 hypothetical protein CPK_ORF00136 [Chlamydia pneumoniae LPCoLN]ETR80656.1 hypothetical protein X556_0016 [Chlamydia pneumoniae B21]CRI33251.1 Uncharacterized protein BN1224_Wien1_A_07580 [Chlamydia pneumoniae]BAA98938.1 hypothetical protein [Chlamydia pneumoniae J138]
MSFLLIKPFSPPPLKQDYLFDISPYTSSEITIGGSYFKLNKASLQSSTLRLRSISIIS